MDTTPPPVLPIATDDDTIPPPSMWLTERHMRLPDGTFPHLGITAGDVAPVALLSGSPDRVELMASMLDDVRQVGARRVYSVFTGPGGRPVWNRNSSSSGEIAASAAQSSHSASTRNCDHTQRTWSANASYGTPISLNA